MYSRDSFAVRMRDDTMAPRIRDGDYLYVDPDEPAVHGRFVAVRDAQGGATTVRLLLRNGGRTVLRTLDGSQPDTVVDAANETDIQGVVVFMGRRV